MKTEHRYDLSVGLEAAGEVVLNLAVASSKIQIAGSIRRREPTVGDIEIVYVPRFWLGKDHRDFFAEENRNLADVCIQNLEVMGVLERRKTASGREIFGPKNKLMRHRRTGIPVDLFSATEENWWNYLLCRTGPAESNIRIATAARRMGWKWNPYGPGFSRGGPLAGPCEIFHVESEEQVFAFVGLPYLAPEDRK